MVPKTNRGSGGYFYAQPVRIRMDTEIIEKLLNYFDCELTDLFEVSDE
jgi:hypothetical protein